MSYYTGFNPGTGFSHPHQAAYTTTPTTQARKPPFLFEIREIKPHGSLRFDKYGRWKPGLKEGDNTPADGVKHTFLCNGETIQPYEGRISPLYGFCHFDTFSTYYAEGHGYWIFKGDALDPVPDRDRDTGETWHPLKFSYPTDLGFLDDKSTFLTNAGGQNALCAQREDQQWPAILLPNTYHAQTQNATSPHGGLQGQLAIFLGLMALSVKPEWVGSAFPIMFVGGAWRTLPDGWHIHWKHKRGIVVSVYTCPPALDPARRGSTEAHLKSLQLGQYGKYFS